MQVIQLTKDEQKRLNKAKKEILTDRHATFSSQSRNYKILQDLAEKYKVDIQVISDMAKVDNQ